MPVSVIGQPVPRLEDARLLRGVGSFVDDIDLAGQLHARIVRSHFAHALIDSIDTESARASEGVRMVITAADLPEMGGIPLRLDFGVPLDSYLQPVLAKDRVRYVGEPVAVVLAEDAYLAEDAASKVEVNCRPLPVVLDAREAIEAEAQSLWDEGGNEAATLVKGFGEIETAFEQAAEIVRTEVSVGRHSGMPLETRGLVADWEPGRGSLTVWGASLVTHYHRRVLSRLLGVSVHRIHMRNTDAGGNFGVRGDFFPEDFLVPWLARQVQRPVKWVEDRAEHMTAINHAREQVHRIEAAFDAEGRILGLRDEVWHNKGAYIRPTGVVVSEITIGMAPWPYRVPAYEGVIHVVTTNKTPLGPYRAPGRYENTFAREQLLNIASAQLEIEPVELRRMNLISDDEMPFRPDLMMNGEAFELNSGHYGQLLDRACETADYASWCSESAAMRKRGRAVGSGLAYFMDKSGLGVYETAGIDIGTDGAVRLLIGGASSGQGIETVMAQIAAETLTVSTEKIDVIHGDTDLIPDGIGSWSSRSTVIGGSAVRRAAEVTRDRALKVAAEMLEAKIEDMVLADGNLHVGGSPSRGVSLAEVAAGYDTFAAHDDNLPNGLGARELYIDPAMNYPYGVAFCQAEVDRVTGAVNILRYFVAYEAGRVINPMLLEGQIVGGVAQGVGGALLEELSYGPDGQPLSTSFMDYLPPTALEMPPRVEALLLEDAPTPTNPLGAKGAGESGIMAVGAAVAAAVSDAIGDPRLVTRLPLTPERVLTMLRTASNT